MSSPGRPTCFYVDGVKAVCLYPSRTESRSIEFLSLNSRNNFNYKIASAKFLEISSYELGQPGTVISERYEEKL